MRGVGLVGGRDTVAKIPDAGRSPSFNQRRELHLKTHRHVCERCGDGHAQRSRQRARVILVAADGRRARPGSPSMSAPIA